MESSTTKKLLIIDDDGDLRKVLATIFEGEGFSPMEAADGADGIGKFEEQPADAVLLDLKLPDMSGFEVLTHMKRSCPSVPVIMMSGFGTVQTAVNAMKLGADNFLLKPLDYKRLIALLKRTTATSGSEGFGAQGDRPLECISAREKEILKLTSSGLTSLEIAINLSISRRTVETHRERVMQKLKLRNRADLVRFAVLNGIV